MRYQAPDDMAREAFHQGQSFLSYKMLGAHPVRMDDTLYWHFAVWAPNAKQVAVTGEFTAWEQESYPMEKQYDGIWELRLPDSLFRPDRDPERFNYEDAEEKLKTYKYAIQGPDDVWHLKADPYGFGSQLRPDTASKLYDLEGYEWGDQLWMKQRSEWNPYTSPINIYEMHLGSWRRHKDGSFLTYAELAEQLVPYLTQMGYTHVELLPVMEHPLDMSWGYQVSGYYAVTARFGEPKDFMAFVDTLHQAGIGVLLDWVPAHFPRDEIGLRQFDGTPCYEHYDPRRAEMPQWGTMMFDYARGEVRSFLMSNAHFWMDLYHIDGLRCDAVSSMLYHDFGREGDFLPNAYGGRENIEAIHFLRQLNEMVYAQFPGVLMVAEESSAFPMVTRPTYLGGLGFGFKWNMGWMNDILSYVELDPIYRKWHHDKLTFSLFYAFSENYILPFSHDEVVHGKKSMLDKQQGDLWQKFAGLRALYGYTMAHPGKKLLFMGSEFAHFIEWKFDDQLDWFLLVYERHPELQRCVKKLNHFYKETPAFYEVEDGWAGFQWLNANDRDNSILSFVRTDAKGNSIVCVSNFTPQFLPVYSLPLPDEGILVEVMNTDLAEFAGSNQYNARPLRAVDKALNGMDYSVDICVPPLATLYFTYERKPKRVVKDDKADESAKPVTKKPIKTVPKPAAKAR